MKRLIETWNGPTPCTCSSCGQDTINGMELVKFDDREKKIVESLGKFTCNKCFMQSHADYKARRKAQLAELPRCEIDGCKARGTFKTSGVLICGRHLSKVKRAHGKACEGLGGLVLFIPVHYSRDEVLLLAKGGAT